MNCTLFNLYLWIQELLGSIPHKWKSLGFFSCKWWEWVTLCPLHKQWCILHTHTSHIRRRERMMITFTLQPSRKGPPCLLSFIWCSSIADGGGEEEVRSNCLYWNVDTRMKMTINGKQECVVFVWCCVKRRKAPLYGWWEMVVYSDF